MADDAGVLIIVALALLLAAGTYGVERRSAARARRRSPATDAAESDALADAAIDSGIVASAPAPDGLAPAPAETRIHVRPLIAVLLLLVVLTGSMLLVPWALASRSLGGGGVLVLALVVVPPAIGLFHAYARGNLEW